MDTEKISSLKKNLNLLAMVELICGLFLIVFNSDSLNMVIKMFGIIAISYGIITFLTWLFKKDKSGAAATIILLAACVTAGLCLIFLTEQINDVFAFVTGIVLIVYGIIKFPNVFKLKKGGLQKWAVGLIPIGLILALGAVIIILKFSNSTLANSLVAILLGIGFIIGCIGDVMTMAGASTIEYDLKHGEEIDADQEMIKENKE
ncbi:MAG: DUF308 domain-containing protein [Oscillospiraceae bacterium]|nr:DUF308 domain-containing protein [Oscillospiraceae bacterium]